MLCVSLLIGILVLIVHNFRIICLHLRNHMRNLGFVCFVFDSSHQALESPNFYPRFQDSLQIFKINLFCQNCLKFGFVRLSVQSLGHRLFIGLFSEFFFNFCQSLTHFASKRGLVRLVCPIQGHDLMLGIFNVRPQSGKFLFKMIHLSLLMKTRWV